MNASPGHTAVSTRFPSWAHYVAPMALFLVLTTLEGHAPPAAYPWLYVLKAVVVTGLLLALRLPWKECQVEGRVLLPAIVVGLLVFAQWILLDKWLPYPHLGSRVGYNPLTAIEDPVQRALFLAMRFYGLVVMVPVMEEIFWRSFLLRYVTDAEFSKLPVGTFSREAFFIVAAAFGLAHSEWLVAVIAACAYTWLLRYTRSLFACIVAHAVTNLTLGIYIVKTGDWVYW